MVRVFFTIAFYCCLVANVQAQDRDLLQSDTIQANNRRDTYGSETGDILSDTVLYINNMVIPEDSVAKWKADNRYAYVKDLEKLLKKKQQELLEHAAPRENERVSFFQKMLDSNLLRAFFWLVAIVFVLVIVYNLLAVKGIFKSRLVQQPGTGAQPDMVTGSVSDYEKLVNLSVSNGDYRSAVRYLYLKMLAGLFEKELLLPAPGKTNEQYLEEINEHMKSQFAALLRIYEYTWYGNVRLDSGRFAVIEKMFIDFYEKI